MIILNKTIYLNFTKENEEVELLTLKGIETDLTNIEELETKVINYMEDKFHRVDAELSRLLNNDENHQDYLVRYYYEDKDNKDIWGCIDAIISIINERIYGYLDIVYRGKDDDEPVKYTVSLKDVAVFQEENF